MDIFDNVTKQSLDKVNTDSKLINVPQGFKTSSCTAGIKKSGRSDMMLIQNVGTNPDFASVWTSNRVHAAPVKLSKESIAADLNSKPTALLVNSGNANACTGERGYEDAKTMQSLTASLLNISNQNVIVNSTGKIGENMPMKKIESGIKTLTKPENLKDTTEDFLLSARAILTTDTTIKIASIKQKNEDGEEFSVFGFVKGSGMIAPGMATMIAVILTDAQIISGESLQTTLDNAVTNTFNSIDVDGCMSTNDSVFLMSSGCVPLKNEDAKSFIDAVNSVCASLALQVIDDGEGASHNIKIEVKNTKTRAEARAIAKSIASSNLLKCAIYGNDPNWGRILSNIGVVPEEEADFDPDTIDIYINNIPVCLNSTENEMRHLVHMSENRVVEIVADMKVVPENNGEKSIIWTNDLTTEYVHINADYTT